MFMLSLQRQSKKKNIKDAITVPRSFIIISLVPNLVACDDK